MTDAGFFKGTSADQDARFADKKKKLMKSMKFGDNLSQKVDMTRVNLECIKPWIIKRITELLNFEDEVVWDYVLNQLEERYPDPKEIQINITGFLNSKNARIFLTELWDLMLSAMENPDGVPAALLEAKKAEISNRQVEERKVQMELRRKQEELIMRTTAPQVSQAAAPPAVAVQHNVLSQLPVPNGATIDSTNPSVRTAHPVSTKASVEPRSTSSSPVRPTEKETDRSRSKKPGSDRKRRHKDRRSRRSRSYSSSSASSADGGSRGHHSRHRHRSRSVEVPVVIKQPVTESDWRKDLMAGRRRSPPQMPENSYYGYEKRKREHKHSRRRHRSSDRDAASDDGYHRPHHSHSRSSRRRGESPTRRIHEDHYRESKYYERRPARPREFGDFVESPVRQYRERRGHYDTRSPSSGSPRGGHSVPSIADRTNKYHDRRAQWAQEEDELATRVMAKDVSSKHVKGKIEVQSDRHSQRPTERARSRSIEGPRLPQSVTKHGDPKKKILPKPMSGSSSEASESESSSSDEESSSSSSESSSSSNGDDDAQVPEGPSLPPSSAKRLPEPEGPSLPPNLVNAQPRTNRPPVVNKEGSSSGSESSSADEEDASGSGSGSDSGSDSSSSSSSQSSSASESKEQSTAPPHKRRREENDPKLVKHVSDHPHHHRHHDKRIPEGPSLPSAYSTDPSSHRKHSNHDSKRSPDRLQRESKREDSAEEALRRRALASLMRAAGDRRRRHSSRSP